MQEELQANFFTAPACVPGWRRELEVGQKRRPLDLVGNPLIPGFLGRGYVLIFECLLEGREGIADC